MNRHDRPDHTESGGNYRISLADGSHFLAADDETLLHAAQRAHWLVRYGCRNGNCNACVAQLQMGTVLQRDIAIDATTQPEILLCLCRAQSDVQIRLPSNPLPGDEANALRCYARVVQIDPTAQGFSVHIALPTGRKPRVFAGQFAILELDECEVRGDIATAQTRELIVHIAADVALNLGEFIYLRYPLGAPQ